MLLQFIYYHVKQTPLFVYAFEVEIYAKEHPSWGASINIKEKVFTESLTLVYNRLDTSSDSSTLVHIRLVTRMHTHLHLPIPI